jgi:hypothetical protein
MNAQTNNIFFQLGRFRDPPLRFSDPSKSGILPLAIRRREAHQRAGLHRGLAGGHQVRSPGRLLQVRGGFHGHHSRLHPQGKALHQGVKKPNRHFGGKNLT